MGAGDRASGKKRLAVVTLLAVGLALAVAIWPAAWLPVCPFHRLTGFPCPTCGSTRCVRALLLGDWQAAFRLQPLVATLVGAGALGLACAWVAVWRGWPAPAVTASRREKWALSLAAVAVVVGNWAHLIVHDW